MRDAAVAAALLIVWQVATVDGVPAQTVASATGGTSRAPDRLASVAPRGNEGDWPRLFIPDSIARRTLRVALEGAARLLTDEPCQALFREFRDRDGRPLSAHLARMNVEPRDYLRLIVFVDGSGQRACSSGAHAFTVPGSRVVHLCVRGFERGWQNNPEHAQATLIHEALHTLGLGENPPSSREITRRVNDRCQ